MEKLLSWLRGGGDELGWDDLIRQVVVAAAASSHYGPRGGVVFPAEIEVVITVAEGTVSVVRDFLEKSKFDREVGAALANRCDCAVADLPVRGYRVEVGKKTSVTAHEGASRHWELLIEGGDLNGTTFVIPQGVDDLRFGRGQWHGAERQIRNDLVVCEQAEFVSRRAGRIERQGNRLEVESLDQGDSLIVHLQAGRDLRPARSSSGRIAVRAGDVIELSGGRERSVCLVVRRK